MKRFNKNRIIVWLLCMCLLISQFSVMADETLPAVGAPTGTVEAEGSSSESLPEDETEVSATEDSSEPQEETTEPAAQELDPSLVQVSEYLQYKEHQMAGQQPVAVINEHTNSSDNKKASDYEAELLRTQRLRKQAELSALDVIVYRSSGFVNVRRAASASAEVVGKMRYNATAQVLDRVFAEDGLWYQIESGPVTGYVKAEFFESGVMAAEIISSIARGFASVSVDAQRLYRERSTESDTLAVLYSGQKYPMESWDDEYVQILYASGESGNFYGYIPRSCVSISWETNKAYTLEAEQRELQEFNRIQYEMSSLDKSREDSRIASVYASESESVEASIQASIAAYQAWLEASIKAVEDESRRVYESSVAEASWLKASAEAAAAYQASVEAAEASRRAAESWAAAEASRQAAEAADRQQQQQENVNGLSWYIPEGTSDLRRRIVTNALQYVGVLDYVFGGYSLSSGTDCSGFLSLIYGQYGIELAHYSYHIAYTGVKVMSIDQARPGDIVCWRTWDASAGRGHVAMYIGRNAEGTPMVVEAPREGLKVRVIPYNSDGLHTIQNVIGD